MLIVYASRTGNVKRFIDKTGLRAKSIKDIDEALNEPYVLVCYTDKFGQVPDEVNLFLENHHENLIGVSASGNKNWGIDLFARSANIISEKYNIPLISKFEMSGGKGDVDNFIKGVLKLYDKMD